MASTAFQEGYDAYSQSGDVVNPYDWGTEAAEEFACGYEAAEREYNRAYDDDNRYPNHDDWIINPYFDGDE
jgi:hypothetical protein